MNSTLMVDAESVLSDELATGEELDLVGVGQIDLVEEIRLRTWARKNYVTAPEREQDWHPVIIDEMSRMDEESLLE